MVGGKCLAGLGVVEMLQRSNSQYFCVDVVFLVRLGFLGARGDESIAY